MADVKIEMDFPMVLATNHVLMSTKIQGRVAMRQHKRILNALIKGCNKTVNGIETAASGDLTLETADWEILLDYCEEIIKLGYPGQFNTGLLDLVEKVEALAKVEDKPEDKKGE